MKFIKIRARCNSDGVPAKDYLINMDEIHHIERLNENCYIIRFAPHDIYYVEKEEAEKLLSVIGLSL